MVVPSLLTAPLPPRLALCGKSRAADDELFVPLHGGRAAAGSPVTSATSSPHAFLVSRSADALATYVPPAASLSVVPGKSRAYSQS